MEKNKKTLIIPDIHLAHERAEKIISLVKPDEIILLGDYFDQFDDTPEMVCDTAEWFQWSVNQPNRVHLCGNHDIHYWFQNNSDQRCSGYEQYKSIIINDIVKSKDWNKLKFFHVLDDWILSHGGVHPYWIDPVKFRNDEEVVITKDQLVSKLERDSKECIHLLNKNIFKNNYNWICVAGWCRSRSPFVGGLIWLDFNQEFHPIRGIHQIVGHTPDRNHIRWKYLKENDKNIHESITGACPELSEKSSYNVCFDSYPALKWYGIYEEKNLNKS
jgi:predicted phosphodiesterase